MVVDAYGELPQILQREQQHKSVERFQQRRKRKKEERFQNMLEATMKRVLRGPSDWPPAPSKLKHHQPVSQLHADMSQLSCQPDQMSDSVIIALKTDELTRLLQVTPS